jgi:hypothetical protein
MRVPPLVDVGNAGIEEAVEALDEADDFDLELVGAFDGAVDGGVEGRRVAAGGQDPDALHARSSRRWFNGTAPMLPHLRGRGQGVGIFFRCSASCSMLSAGCCMLYS